MSQPLIALAIHKGKWAHMSPDGEIDDSATIPGDAQILCCHAPYTAARADLSNMPQWDVLELFAFLKPGIFCVPTIAGLCDALSLPQPDTVEDACMCLHDCVRELLHHIKGMNPDEQEDIMQICQASQNAWPWAPPLLQQLGAPATDTQPSPRRVFLKTARALPEWAEQAPPVPADYHGIESEGVLQRLNDTLSRHQQAEPRAQQKTYAIKMISAFAPPAPDTTEPHMVLAEAGTGTGKTLGYLTPAIEWAEKNETPIWVSTYTRNLQQQVEKESALLYPNAAERKRKVVIRKGRDNYLCLHKFEDMAARAPMEATPRPLIAAAIMARWIGAGHDGDFTGTAFPGWLSGLLGFANTLGLADRNRECTYSACDHYKRCFVESSRRRAGHARLVIANHALVMTQAAMGNPNTQPPARLVFDEGHHLFDAADSAFAAHLSAREGLELRRWLLGSTAQAGQQRNKGLAKRLEGLITQDDEKANAALDALLLAAKQLPAQGAMKRIQDTQPKGAIETLLHYAMRQIKARTQAQSLTSFGGEVALHPLDDDLRAFIPDAIKALTAIRQPMVGLAKALADMLEEREDDALEPAARRRNEAMITGLQRRADTLLGAWLTMLEDCADPQAAEQKEMVDWLECERGAQGFTNIGLYRHMIDPMHAFATSMRSGDTHGMVVTSATLTDTDDTSAETTWHRAEQRTGASYFETAADRLALASPFDYNAQSKIILVQGLNKNDVGMTAMAMRDLFLASQGGAVGLFTAIHRLRSVAQKLTPQLADHGIDVLSQHMDSMDIGTLIDIFRADIDACLLGTDAVRDGVDVPGKSLRLIAFDRVPWPRPTLLHKRRRTAFGGRDYDDAMTRMKLKQAYGRLIRSGDDKGVFVMLDSSFPSRLHDAFPASVTIEKHSLPETLDVIKTFLP